MIESLEYRASRLKRKIKLELQRTSADLTIRQDEDDWRYIKARENTLRLVLKLFEDEYI